MAHLLSLFARPGSISDPVGAEPQAWRRDRRSAAAVAVAGMAVLIRLTGIASDLAFWEVSMRRMQDPADLAAVSPSQSPRFAGSFARQLTTAPGIGEMPQASPSRSCVVALGRRGNLTVGSADLSRDTTVKLAGCDLYNDSDD
ncbi:MAG TPA: hypothetical protein VKF83_01185, partial [Stellaceae bacterium]|nr:hypothetical protein [Stellaceae bacterium]